MGDHGPFVPEGVRYNQVTRDHFKAWLYVLIPGMQRRKRVFIGDTRRCQVERKGARDYRYWRAFSVFPEFPPVLNTNRDALEYLKRRWEAMSAMPSAEPRPQRGASPQEWEEWLGRNPFADPDDED